MRWIIVCCILLATALDVLSTHRSKRDLKSIKNLISSSLFGTETIVIQIPKIPKSETFQLFKIKGYDGILLKVVRKPQEEKDKNATEKMKDLVMVSPEIAIIGKYLGTTTQGETLLALELAKNLLKSGILSGERVLKVQEPVNMISSKRDPIYILPDSANKIELVNSRPVAVYPQPIVVTSEVEYRPLQTNNSHKQEEEHADIKHSIEDTKLNQTNLDKEKTLKKYVYVPPMNIDIPPVPIVNSFRNENANIKGVNGLSSTLEPKPIRTNNGADKILATSAPTTSVDDNNVNNYLSSMTPTRPINVAVGSTTVLSILKERLGIIGLQAPNEKRQEQTGTLKTNAPISLNRNPIVVADIPQYRSKGSVSVTTRQPGPKLTNTRPFTGGPMF